MVRATRYIVKLNTFWAWSCISSVAVERSARSPHVECHKQSHHHVYYQSQIWTSFAFLSTWGSRTNVSSERTGDARQLQANQIWNTTPHIPHTVSHSFPELMVPLPSKYCFLQAELRRVSCSAQREHERVQSQYLGVSWWTYSHFWHIHILAVGFRSDTSESEESNRNAFRTSLFLKRVRVTRLVGRSPLGGFVEDTILPEDIETDLQAD